MSAPALRRRGCRWPGLNTRPGNVEAGETGLCALPGREEEAIAAIDEAVDYAEAVGAGYVHVMAGKPGDSAGARETFLRALDHAASQAERRRQIVVMEPLNARDAPGYFLANSALAVELIEELGRDNVKILFDCYHFQITEGDLIRRFESLLPMIGHLQIAGVPSRAEPDEGEVCYERLLGAISEAGYDGFVGAEYRARGSVEDGLGWLAAFREAGL